MPNINTITYNSIQSDSLGVFVTGSGSFDAAELDVIAYEIPGRNGDLLIPNNRYKNIEIIYPAFVPSDFKTRVQAIRNWLRGANGYVKLSDTYDTTHYRMALNSIRQSFEPVNRNNGANFELVFNCKPQRFLTTGDTATTVTTGTVLSNPTSYVALPRFIVNNNTSSATLKVVNSLGTFQMTATAARSSTTYIDCDNQNIYYSTTNFNHLFSGDFPVFAPGNNTITFSGITSLQVRPRWWEL